MAWVGDDPFTQVYDKLWTALIAHDKFQTQVRLGNRIDLQSDEAVDPYKDVLQAGDLPEVILRPAAGSVHLRATSNRTLVTQSYVIDMTTGDLRTNVKLFPIQWAIIQAIHGAGETLGLSFVKHVTITGVEDTETGGDRRLATGVEGWTSIITINVEMWFTDDDLEVED